MTKKQGITKRQQELFKIIANFKARFGYAPTLKEMATRLGVKSDQAVLELLGRLERHGALRRTPGISRSVVLLQDASSGELMRPSLNPTSDWTLTAPNDIGDDPDEAPLTRGSAV